jgi:serine phosphatase RsbU (regulator of sigma subunit)/PAS domain-containing protein
MADRTYDLPDPALLALLDTDPQGWVLARSVREQGRIVDFRLVYINDAGCGIIGRAREDLVGGLYRQMWPETVHEETLPLYCRVVETQQPVTRTVYYDRATVAGHFELSISPYGDGFGIRFVDLRQVTVTPRSTGGTRLYDMLDAAFDGFTLLRSERDSSGQIVDFVCEYVNQLGAKLAGRAVEDIIGQRISEVSPDSWESGLFDKYRTVAETGEPWREQLPYPEVSQVWEVKIGRADPGTVAVSFREITGQVDQQAQLQLALTRAEEAAARANALQSVTTALVAASTTAEVYAAIGAVLRPSAGGHGLALLLRDGEHLRLRFDAGYEPEVVERLLELPLDHPYPATAVARTGQGRYLSSVAEFHAAQRESAAPIPRGGRQAWAFLPLAVAGEVLGTLVVGYGVPRTFEADERAMLTALAALTAQALQRALLFEARTSMAATLQRALLPGVLPVLPGLRHAARYLPWTLGAEVGGDWYDVIALDGESVGVVIGDVAGHNVTAAAAMGQVRNALRAYATERHSPAATLRHVNQLLWDLRLNTMVTCCYIEIHPAEGTATAVLAGHPPPVLRTARGTGLLRMRPGVPLGVTRNATYTDATFALTPGDTLLLYTDGLVEDRRHAIDQGLAELCTALASAPADDPEAILDHILAGDVGPRPRSDDVAVICLTNNSAPADRRSAQRHFRSEAISAPAARRFAADVLTMWHQPAVIDDALLLLDELVTNAVQNTTGDVTVRLELDRAVRISVSDTSDHLPYAQTVPLDSDAGRGLQIVDRLAAAWGAEALPGGGKCVWCELPAA